MPAYECTASLPEGTFEASATITEDEIILRGVDGSRHALPFADLMDMRLVNYRLALAMRDYEAEISKLGYLTEDFFEKLWEAYSAKSERALFVEGDLVMRSEGDYAYAEPGVSRNSIAKLALRTDCLCILPHDAGARRVPLCFADAPEREGFSLELRLDTGEAYRIARLGGDTDPFFGKLADVRESVSARWREAHRALEANLDARLGEAAAAYETFQGLDANIVVGLFSADSDAFWIAAIGDGRAAVELVTDEKAATYLYRFDVARDDFEAKLRHAMEAMKANRRIIYVPQEEIDAEPLYRMAVERSPHVRTLRSCNAGRVIHSASWSSKVVDFFK